MRVQQENNGGDGTRVRLMLPGFGVCEPDKNELHHIRNHI